MPIYTYETIPAKPGQKARRFEAQQSMLNTPLQKDPKTGLPVRRVITGGLEIPRGSTPSPTPHTCGCGNSCGCGG